MSIVSTITVPAQGDPNYLHQCLHELIKNSYYKHRIIVIYDHPNPGVKEGARDFSIDPKTGERTQPHKNLDEFFTSHAGWLQENGIELRDVTDRYQLFYASYGRGEVYPGKTLAEGGVNIAFKDNVGLEMTTTEWMIPNWDTDFHPSMHWDKPIFDYALNLSREIKEVVIPMHVQPQYMDGNPADFDAWGTLSRSFARTHMAIPSRKRDNCGAVWVTEAEFFAYAERNKRSGLIVERCGDREQLHWVPWILRTEEIRKIGGFNYQGSGYDLEFDDRLRDKGGFSKVGICDSFVLHKGWAPLADGVCNL
jgi:hypothetical protein